MEHGNSFFHYGQPEKSSSDSNRLHGEGNSSSEQQKQVAQQAETAREENRSVPMACVQRLIRNFLPSYAKVSDESKVKIVECVTEFISLITVVANHRCQVEQRKTVTAEDLLYAMAKLGFDNYAELLTLYLHRYRQHHEGDNRVPHRAGSLPTLPAIVNINDAVPTLTSSVGGFPVIPPIVPNPMMGGFHSDGSSGGGSSSSANVAYFNRDNSFGN